MIVKRKLSCIICAVLAFCLSYAPAYAEDVSDSAVNTAYESEVYFEAKTLLNCITGKTLFNEDSENVTRLEFVNALVTVLKSPYVHSADAEFSDAPSEKEAYGAVYTALSNGWISPGENFYPENAIKFDEAVKISVSAMGYDKAAQSFGGYPSGYVRIAMSLGLCDDVLHGETIDGANAAVFMFNLLKCSWTNLADYGTSGEIKFVRSGDNYLSALYRIYETEGTVNATSYNSLEYGLPVAERKFIEINGVSYNYDGVKPDMLANYIRAYYKEINGRKEIVSVISLCESIRLELSDYIDYSDGKIKYENENGREKSIKLSGSPYMIFNGRLVNGFDKSKFDGDGFAVITDRDDDGIFDTVYINSYTYTVVLGVDRYNGMIGDKNSAQNSINLKKISQDGAVWAKSADGSEIDAYGIKDGDVLCVKKSDDGLLIEIEVIDNYVSGSANEILSDGKYVIDGVEYEMSEYFEKYLKDELKLGESGRFAIGYGGMLVSLSKSEGGYKYGYLIECFQDEKVRDSAKIKLFSQEGKTVNLYTAEKVMIDGVNKKSVKEILKTVNIGGSERHSAVKYFINSDGKISKLDFPADYDEELGDFQTSNPDDCFVYYKDFTGKSLTYRSPNTTFNSFFNVSGAVCMSIPSDIEAAERYFRKGAPSEIFSNNSAYTNIYAYDIDDFGKAAFVIENYNKNNEIKPGGKENVYVVCSTTRRINADGDEATGITAWRSGKFYTFCFADDLSFTRDVSPSVKAGDVVRIKADAQNTVYSLTVDFNVTAFDKNSTLTSANYQNKNASYSCWFGMPYSLSGNYMQLMTDKDIDQNYITSKNGLKNFSVNTANIVRVDLKSNEVRPVNKTEIKTYKSFGDDAECIWIVQDCDAPVMIVLFDNYKD